MSLNLRTKDKKRIIELFEKTIHQKSELIAFGSRVNGDSHEMSDLDLVIKEKNGNKIEIDQFLSFKEALQKSNIPIIVQVLDWARIPISFHNNILEKYEVLYEK